MNSVKHPYSAVVDWRFDGNWFVDGLYVQDVGYLDGYFDRLKAVGYDSGLTPWGDPVVMLV